MRFKNYINDFRSYTIKLTTEHTDNIKKLEEIINTFNINTNIIKMVDGLNKNFRKNQRSKLFFDFCLEDEGIEINKAKINKKVKEKFKLKCLTFNDELCKIQRKIEKDLKIKED